MSVNQLIDKKIENILDGSVINYYIHLAVETGLLGLAAFLGLIFVHMKYLLVRLKGICGDRKVIQIGVITCLISFLIHINFERILNVHFMGILFGLFLGMGIKIAENGEENKICRE